MWSEKALQQAVTRRLPEIDPLLAASMAACLKGCVQAVVRQCKKTPKSHRGFMSRLKGACGPNLLKTRKRKSFGGAHEADGDPFDPSNMETQPLIPGSPPRCLGEVVATLELEGVEPFPHTLQYKKQFRDLLAKKKQGTHLKQRVATHV